MNAGESVDAGAGGTERQLVGQAVVLLSQVVEILRSVAEGGQPIIAEPVTTEDAVVSRFASKPRPRSLAAGASSCRRG